MESVAVPALGRSAKIKATHVGYRDMHSLTKAFMMIGLPLFVGWLISLTASSGPNMTAGFFILIFAVVMVIIGLPLLILAIMHFFKGIGIVAGNMTSKSQIQNPTHVLHSKHGIRLYGDTASRTFSIGGRRYDFDAVSVVDYIEPQVRIRLSRGANALEVIDVGMQQDCERYMRGFCDMVGLDF